MKTIRLSQRTQQTIDANKQPGENDSVVLERLLREHTVERRKLSARLDKLEALPKYAKWVRNENGQYDLNMFDYKLARITPKSEPGKQAKCWEFVKLEYKDGKLIGPTGIYPSLKEAKEAYK